MAKQKKFEKRDIENYLRTLDGKLKSKVDLVLLGGTALTITKKRDFSLDIDFCYKTNDADFHGLALDVGKELGYELEKIDIHRDFDIGMLRIPDYEENALEYKALKLKNINLKLLNPADIVISKLCRSAPKDINDIKKMLDDKEISVNDIRRRLTNLMRSQFVDYRAELDNKVTSFLESYAKRK